jgi:23S rRNA G2069 N7-methylase RlmK/C1962 C5-methylase RlmI
VTDPIEQRIAEQASMLRNRLEKNLRNLRQWAKRGAIECYRVYDGDIPELRLAIDLYGEYVHVGEYSGNRGGVGDDPRWEPAMRTAIGEATGHMPIAFKARRREHGALRYGRFDDRGERVAVNEGGLKFLVNLTDYVDTGLFLDHRISRADVRKAASGRRVLNLFCYTGAFSVYAADGAAASTTSVDVSNTYLQWADDNLTLNGLRSPRNQLVRDDVLQWVESPARERERYDIIVLDPPTFSRGKRMDVEMDIVRDHAWMIRRTARLLDHGGVLYFSTNAKQFEMDHAGLGGLEAVETTKHTVPLDFARSKPHRSWTIRNG